ncbi:MAG: hypothetical protein ACTTKH_03170 [Treponema sp.]
MLYNIAFQDNIYILLRQIDTLYSGLQLDLDEKLFAGKILSDLVFFDRSISVLFEQIYPQSALHNFIDVLQCLHFCISKYLDLINFITSNQSNCKITININDDNLTNTSIKHKEMIRKIEEIIDQNDASNLENELVSQNELACLLNA